MNQSGDKSESDNDSSSDSKSGTSSGSDSESGSASSSSSASQNSNGSHRSKASGSISPPPPPEICASTPPPPQICASTPPPPQISGKSISKNSNNSSSSGSDDDNSDEEVNRSNATAREEYNTSTKSSPDDDEDYTVKKVLRKKAPPAKRAAPPPKRKNTNWNSASSESDNASPTDSEDEPRPKARKRPAASNRKAAVAKRKNNRGGQSQQQQQHYTESESDDENKRSATRRAAAAVSYKEASEDEETGSDDRIEVDFDDVPVVADEPDKSETIERIIARRMGKKGVTGNTTTVYAVEENGDPNLLVNDQLNDVDVKPEDQFFIKWKGWSHIHNTWESEESLREQKVKGMKKLKNFITKDRELGIWRKYAGPEDIDYYECQLELQQELLKSYNFVDRIIAQVHKPDDGGVDYLCKWECLPYSEATWEDITLVQRKWSDKIADFDSREGSKKTPSTHSKVLKYRPKFHHVKGQPDYMGVDRGLLLRDYQMDGLNWLILTWCKDNSVILADEMGLGKTIQTICFLYYLFMEQNLHGPYLCVVPLSTMTAWQREFDIWAPRMNIVTYLGDVQSRETIRQYEWCFDGTKRLKFNAILTTYEILLKDKVFLGSVSWAALLVDEAHRLKNDDSLLYKALYDFDTNHRLLITGTPLQNSLKELWALLHFIMPSKFETWEDFEKMHGNAEDKGYAKLHKQLEPYILRRVKKDVEKSLPAKVEQILRVEMTSVQKQYYKWILTKNFNALRKGVRGSTSTFLNIVIELKKCCNHAMLIRPLEYEAATNHHDAVQMLLKGSGKLVLLDKLLCRLRETGHRVLIFSQMVRMLDILAEYLQKRHFPFQRLDGSIKGEIRKQALDHFNAEGSTDFCFLLSTRAGGLGINLATADTVIIFDSDWNPQNDLQAQARAHRIGQKNQVNIYRLVTARSVEEEIVERAKQKMVLDHLVIQRMDTTGRTVLDKNSSSTTTPFNKEDLSAILKFGAEELFKDEPEGDGDDLVCDIDEILRRAETRDDAPTMIGDELLSAFKVASFAAFDEENNQMAPTTKAAAVAREASGDGNGVGVEAARDWENIIPEQLRKEVEEQERNQAVDLYLPPRRKTLQQINNHTGQLKVSRNRKRRKEMEYDSDDGSDVSVDGQPRKRGRPPVKEKFPNFTDADLRRFIKSFKKFPAPLKRLDAIACDAYLLEKPLPELKKLGEQLHERCVSFLEEVAKEPVPIVDGTEAKKRGARAGYSMKFGGVSFNAKTLMSCEEELQPLDDMIPANAEERAKWTIGFKPRLAHFDVEWTPEDDTKLLCGIYQYGLGSWEAMKLDPVLGIADKILSANEKKKPQARHLQQRSEYLLKLMKKMQELKNGPGKAKKKRKPKVKSKDIKSKDIIENDVMSTDDEKNMKKKDITDGGAERLSGGDGDSTTNSMTATPAGAAKKAIGGRATKAHNKEPKKGKKKTDGPMHFTANNEPRALNVLGDLDPNVFNECKEKMRPVKKALKALDNPDQTLSTPEQVNHTRACLLSIGRQIDECLMVYKEPDKIKEWRSNLWYFVSKFTEFDAKKLFKLYKHALKRSEDPTSAYKSLTHHGKDSNNVKETKMPNNKSPTKKQQQQQQLQKDAVVAAGDTTASDKIVKEKRERKERKKQQKDKDKSRAIKIERDIVIKVEKEDSGGSGRLDNGHSGTGRDETSKRKLEDGECEPDGKEHKRLHGSGGEWNREDRKKWDSNSSDQDGRIRRNSASNLLPPPRGAAPTTPQRTPMAYADPRSGAPPDGRVSAGGGSTYNDAERWNTRDRFSDHKRDRFDNSYNNSSSSSSRVSPHGYVRDRDHRDRDRDRDRRNNKRRYPPQTGYANNHYTQSGNMYYPPGGTDGRGAGAGDFPPGYRERYPSSSAGGGAGVIPIDWSRAEREYGDYRRNSEYDRRPPPANS